ncbi:C2H2-type domain-containing protein [Plasmodiophora brassicae]
MGNSESTSRSGPSGYGSVPQRDAGRLTEDEQLRIAMERSRMDVRASGDPIRERVAAAAEARLGKRTAAMDQQVKAKRDRNMELVFSQDEPSPAAHADKMKVCNVCGRGFKSQTSLNLHTKTDHGRSLSASSSSASSRTTASTSTAAQRGPVNVDDLLPKQAGLSDPSLKTCMLCGQEFKSQTSLNMHLKNGCSASVGRQMGRADGISSQQTPPPTDHSQAAVIHDAVAILCDAPPGAISFLKVVCRNIIKYNDQMDLDPKYRRLRLSNESVRNAGSDALEALMAAGFVQRERDGDAFLEFDRSVPISNLQILLDAVSVLFPDE